MDADVFRFDEATHTYFLNNEIMPSVTEIMRSAGLFDWAKNIHDYFKDRGSMVHLATHLYDTAGLDWNTVDERIVGFVKAWIQFKADTGCEVVSSEKQEYNKTLWYAGTIDRVINLYGKVTLLDLKSNGVPDSVEIQLGAYEKIIKHKIDEARGLALKEDGTYSLTPPLNLRRGWRAFKAALEIHNWKNRKKG